MRLPLSSSLPLLLVSRSSSLLASNNNIVNSIGSKGSKNTYNLRHMHKDTMYPPVSDFVKDAALALTTSSSTTTTTSQPIPISLGNPAGDADSIISAIALAYIDTMSSAESCSSNTGDTSSSAITTTTPIVSIPYESLTTQRPETKYLLQQLAKIDLNDLIDSLNDGCRSILLYYCMVLRDEAS